MIKLIVLLLIYFIIYSTAEDTESNKNQNATRVSRTTEHQDSNERLDYTEFERGATSDPTNLWNIEENLNGWKGLELIDGQNYNNEFSGLSSYFGSNYDVTEDTGELYQNPRISAFSEKPVVNKELIEQISNPQLLSMINNQFKNDDISSNDNDYDNFKLSYSKFQNILKNNLNQLHAGILSQIANFDKTDQLALSNGYDNHDILTNEISKNIYPVPIHQPFHIPIPIHIPHPIPISIPVPVPVEKTVTIPVEKQVPYPVEKPIPYEVIKHIPYPVPQPYPVPVPVYKTKYIHKIKSH